MGAQQLVIDDGPVSVHLRRPVCCKSRKDHPQVPGLGIVVFEVRSVYLYVTIQDVHLGSWIPFLEQNGILYGGEAAVRPQ